MKNSEASPSSSTSSQLDESSPLITDLDFIVKCLSRIPIFEPHVPSDLKALAMEMEKIPMQNGDRRTTEWDSLYVLQSGEIELHMRDSSKTACYSTSGDYFGDLALLYKKREVREIVATQASILYSLSYEKYQQKENSLTSPVKHFGISSISRAGSSGSGRMTPLTLSPQASPSNVEAMCMLADSPELRIFFE